MVHTKFGENRDPFCSFFKDFFFKKQEKLKKLKINGTQGGNGKRAGGSKFSGKNLEGKKVRL